MEFAIFNIFVLLIVAVLQWYQFRKVLKENSNEIARMRDINHAIAEKLWNKTTENRSLKALLGKKVCAIYQ